MSKLRQERAKGWPRNLAVGSDLFFGRSANWMPLSVRTVWILYGHGRDQGFEEAAGRHHVGGLHELNEGELGRSVDGNEEVEFAFRSAHLGDVDMEVADRIGFELALGRLVAFDVGKPRDAVTLQATMQGRARQMRHRCLQRVEAIVERQ